jgi:predicted MFS family arabinose efflux permease
MPDVIPPSTVHQTTQVESPIRAFRESAALLLTRRFGIFFTASLLSNIGSWAQLVAEPWLLLNLGASSFLIGLDSFALSAPAWMLTLLGGVLADHRDRRRVITLFQATQMLCPAAIAVLLAVGKVHIGIVIVLSFVIGITDALSMPSFQSIVPSIVKRQEINAAITLNSTQFNLSRILGPALAGVLLSTSGAIGCFIVSAASYVPFIGVALWVLPRRAAPSTPKHRKEEWQSALAGFREILEDRRLRGALLTLLITSVFCAPLITFCPVLIKASFNGTAAAFSSTVATFGIGGLVGATALLGVGERTDRGRLSNRLAMAYAVTVALAAVDPWFYALPIIVGAGGLFMTASNISANALLQSTVSDRLRGRAASLNMMAMRGGISIGGLVTGMAIDIFDVRTALLMDGVLALLALAIVAATLRNDARRTHAHTSEKSS